MAEKLETYESIQIGAFNCEKDKPFCQSFGVNGYPTLGSSSLTLIKALL